MSCGGISSTAKEADEHVRSVIRAVEEELKTKISEKRNGAHPENLEVICYKTQVVAGSNFFINIKVGEGEYVHVRIYRDLSGTSSLHSITDIKNEVEEISYF